MIWGRANLGRGQAHTRKHDSDQCFQNHLLDIPGGPVAGRPPARAGDAGLIPSQGGFHTPWGNWARELRLLKPESLEPMLGNRRRRRSETELESSPHSLQLEKARMQQWRPSAAENKIFFKIIKQTKTKTLPRGQGIYLGETQSAFLHFF